MIQKTRNYDQFKVIEGNRKLNSQHLSRLTMSIAKKNLLEHSPIMVNENMEVIDGQHRLEVARQNKLSIYYVVVPEAGLQDVIDLNTNLRNWRLTDFVESLIIQGNPEMRYLQEFCNEYGVSITSGILLHHGTATGFMGSGSTMRLSRLKFTEDDRARGRSAGDLLFDIRQYVSRRGSLPSAVVRACFRIADEGNAKKVGDAIKKRGKILSLSTDTNVMYDVLMSYIA